MVEIASEVNPFGYFKPTESALPLIQDTRDAYTALHKFLLSLPECRQRSIAITDRPHLLEVGDDIKSFLRSAIETAFKEVRPRGKEYSTPEKTINSLEHRRIDGFNEALSDYDQAVDKYLGK